MSNPYTNYIKVGLTQALTKAINEAAKTNPELSSCISELEGSRVGIEITDLRLSFAMTVIDHTALVEDSLNQLQLDLLIRGKTAGFFKLIRASDWNPQMINHVEIIGDVQLAQKLYRIFKSIDFDWEEEIAKRAGDVPARQIGNFARFCKRTIFARDSSLKEKIRTKLVKEKYILPEPSRVEQFIDKVDQLQEDIDRLEKRVDRFPK